MTIVSGSFRAFLLPVLFSFLFGCAAMQPGMVRDIKTLPQDAAHYIDNPDRLLIRPELQVDLYQGYRERFFSPWNMSEPRHTSDQVFWGLERYESRDIYGENNLPLPADWIEKMRQKSDPSGYPSVHIPAITVIHSSMRVLPTSRPVFYAPERPGQGFPFDYMQNTLVPAGTPLLITHESTDKEWLLAETGFAAGWIRRHELAIVDQEFIMDYAGRPLAGFLADSVPVTACTGEFLVSGRVGMALPILQDQENDGILRVLVPARDHLGNAQILSGLVPEKDARKLPFYPDQKNFARILNAMMGQAYGWGGLFENRDCSALIKDVFAGFGVYLPRNSAEQSRAGNFISFENLTVPEKKKLIQKTGKPWMTILYMPGHVMLYLGLDPDSGRIAAYHSMWGLRTSRPFSKTHGRWVIGRTVVTSLEPGKEMRSLACPEGLLINRLTGMVILPGT